jgi:hypothetical protein
MTKGIIRIFANYCVHIDIDTALTHTSQISIHRYIKHHGHLRLDEVVGMKSDNMQHACTMNICLTPLLVNMILTELSVAHNPIHKSWIVNARLSFE